MFNLKKQCDSVLFGNWNGPLISSMHSVGTFHFIEASSSENNLLGHKFFVNFDLLVFALFQLHFFPILASAASPFLWTVERAGARALQCRCRTICIHALIHRTISVCVRTCAHQFNFCLILMSLVGWVLFCHYKLEKSRNGIVVEW